MKVCIEYAGQLRRPAGASREEFECDAGTSLEQLLRRIAGRSEPDLAGFLLEDDGVPRRSLVIAVNDVHVVPDRLPTLEDGDVVLLLSPVAGG